MPVEADNTGMPFSYYEAQHATLELGHHEEC